MTNRGKNWISTPRIVILRTAEESSRATACGDRAGFFAKPQKDNQWERFSPRLVSERIRQIWNHLRCRSGQSCRLRRFTRAALAGALWVAANSIAPTVAAAEPAPALALKSGDRVVFLGDTLMEREQRDGWIELMLTTRFADQDVVFRNLGWSADTPGGASRIGLSPAQAGKEPEGDDWKQLVKQLEETRPTVVFLGYGMASSFQGAAGLARFKSEYIRLLDTLARITPAGRVVVLSPIPHEALPAPWPNPVSHNEQLGAYAAALREIAGERKLPFVPLFDALRNRSASTNAAPLTQNGIHLTSDGYRRAAEVIEDMLFGSAGTWRTSAQRDLLRQAIQAKNEWYFRRSRPANIAYTIGFRQREQGKNAGEIAQFDPFVAVEEKRIARLRALQPVDLPPRPPAPVKTARGAAAQPRPDFEIADGLEVTLWAENPMLHKPVQMNFDARGRLWIASSEAYPQIEPGQPATDKIVVLEDTQGGGRADTTTVFADGLLIPTGIEPGDGGVYVAQSDQLLHLADTDGDGRADTRRIVLSGFGTEDTHHNLHTLRWGPDGRLYMNQSIYTRTATETPHGVVRLSGGGIFRFSPGGDRFEVIFPGWINTWGHAFDAFGQSFVTDGAGSDGIAWAVPGADHGRGRGALPSISPGAYPKFCGIEVVRSAHFPAAWQGDMITCDFRAHRLVRFKVADRDSAYLAKEMPDVLRTTASAFRPIDVKLGPDGALYIADWSNPIIQHGEVDFRDPRRDKEHGRIWRISAKGRAPLPKVDFTKRSTGELLDTLLSANGYDVDRARRVLIERGPVAVEKDLTAWTARNPGEPARLQAMWLAQALNLPRQTLPAELATVARDARIRAAAVRALPESTERVSLAKVVRDSHPRVRLEAVRALAKFPTAEAAALALTVVDQPMDVFLNFALRLALAELAEPWLAAVSAGTWQPAGREKQLEFALDAIDPAVARNLLRTLVGGKGVPRDGSGPWIELIGASRDPNLIRVLLDQLLREELVPGATTRVLEALAGASRLHDVKPAGDLTGVGKWLASPDRKVRLAALKLAGTWKLSGLTAELAKLASAQTASADERAAALAALRDIGTPDAVAHLRQIARETKLGEARREAIVALAAINFTQSLPDVVAEFNATTDETQAQPLWRSVLQLRGASTRLATEFTQNPPPKEVARIGLRVAREGSQHQALAAVLMKGAGFTLAAKLSPSELRQLALDALAKGDPVRGEELYRRTESACVACHAIGGVGGKVGPDLTSIGASAPADYLLESLLYPNEKIKEGYHSVLVTTREGRELGGIIVRENATEVHLRDAANREVSLAVKDIARRANVGSMMPAGLLDGMLPEERLDLVKFLAMLGRPGDYDAAKGGVARLWKIYAVTSFNQQLGIERVVQGDAALADWLATPTLVNGTLRKEAYAAQIVPARGNVRELFAAVRFVSAQSGPVTFHFTGHAKRLWVNGKLTPVSSTLVAPVSAGLNTLVLQLDEITLPDAIRLRSDQVTFLTNID